MSEHTPESDHIVSHPGQCCDGYCVEGVGVHGMPSRADAEHTADIVQVAVDRALSKAAALPTHSTRGDFCGQQQPHGAHVWTNPIPLGSTAITTPRQCAGLSNPPGVNE